MFLRPHGAASIAADVVKYVWTRSRKIRSFFLESLYFYVFIYQYCVDLVVYHTFWYENSYNCCLFISDTACSEISVKFKHFATISMYVEVSVLVTVVVSHYSSFCPWHFLSDLDIAVNCTFLWLFIGKQHLSHLLQSINH